MFLSSNQRKNDLWMFINFRKRVKGSLKSARKLSGTIFIIFRVYVFVYTLIIVTKRRLSVGSVVKTGFGIPMLVL